MYNNTVKDHFIQPRNVGELEKPDCVGWAKNNVDGDQVQLHLRIKKGRITDIRMKVMGCVAAIASTSLLTELAKGKTIEEAALISKKILVDKLGGLPEQKQHCSLTCIDALKKALREKKIHK
jgi:nitrogen fixation NifU-like protein